MAGDIIVRPGLIAALNYLRAHPDDLDAIWASIAQDGLTSSSPGYGLNQVQLARAWFLAREIPVFLNIRVPDDLRSGAFITVSALKSDEQVNTLGDSTWVQEDVEAPNPWLCAEFTPTGYDKQTRVLTIPATATALVVLTDSVLVVNNRGTEYGIARVIDDTHVVLDVDQGAAVDLNRIRLRYPHDSHRVSMGGAVFRETYGIGCHSYEEPIHALYLHAIVAHILTRHRVEFFEARGFQSTSFSTGALEPDSNFGAELGYSRYVTLTGQFHHLWTTEPSEKVQAVEAQFRVTGANGAIRTVDVADDDDLLWLGQQDTLGLRVSS